MAPYKLRERCEGSMNTTDVQMLMKMLMQVICMTWN